MGISRPICETPDCTNLAKKQSKRRKDGSVRYCKICASCQRKKYGISNRGKPMHRRSDDAKKRRYAVDKKRRIEFYAKLKAERLQQQDNRCANKFCSIDEQLPLFCYDFHHQDPELKEHALSKLTSKSKMQIEANKCILLCAICHRLVHHKPSAVRF